MKLISAPFSFKGQGYLGKIYRPYITLLVTSKYIDEWLPLEMVVDSGADYTLLPRGYARLLLIDLAKDCFAQETAGIGGREKVYLCKRLVGIKIGSWEEKIPVGILDRDDIPGLLGRLDCLEKLGLVMKDFTTILEK
jgi:predicted aspartyl protease